MCDDPQQDELGVVFARQVSCEIDSLERGRRTVDPDQNVFPRTATQPKGNVGYLAAALRTGIDLAQKRWPGIG